MNCSGTLTDVAICTCGLYIPSFMRHLILRPMQHVVVGRTSMSPNLIRGLVVMEFNGQIFRRDITVPRDGVCRECHRPDDARDRYELEVRKAVRQVSRDVNRVVKDLLHEALVAMDSNGCR